MTSPIDRQHTPRFVMKQRDKRNEPEGNGNTSVETRRREVETGCSADTVREQRIGLSTN